MKRRVIIHAGLPKCGSSSLQFILMSNREVLAEAGISYPDISALAPRASDATRTGHMLLGSLLIEANRPGGEAPCALLADIVADFDRSGHHTLILSSESFVMKATRYDRAMIGGLLDDCDVEIVIFTRRHDLWVTSYYKQSVKAGGRQYDASFDRFLADPPPYAANITAFDLTRRASRLRDAFGAGAVHVIDLDAAGQDILSLFGTMIDQPIATWPGRAGVLMPYNAALFERGLPINRSLSDTATAFLADMNKAASGGKRVRGDTFRPLIAALTTLKPSGDIPVIKLLTPELSRTLIDAGARDRRRLNRRFDVPITAPEPEAFDPAADYRQQLTRDEWLAIIDRIAPELEDDTRAAFAPAIASVRAGAG